MEDVPGIYFVERRLYQTRLNHLKSLARRSGLFQVCTNPREAKILISQDSTGDEVVKYLTEQVKMIEKGRLRGKKLVDVSWFTLCMKEKSLAPIKNDHLLLLAEPASNTDNVSEPSVKRARISPGRMPMYACQRRTPLKHPNEKLTEALEVLEQHALFRGDKNGEARALAFRRGSATLKACASPIKSVKDLQNLPFIDSTDSSKVGHCKQVITEIVEEGFSDEVENVINSDFYKSMKLFCGIFGVGPQTARKWYFDLGLRSLDDVRKQKALLTSDQILGLDYYYDLNTPVTVEEANYIQKMISDTCRALRHGVTVTLVGGFRRGKSEGHDVDLLISHPENGKEKGILSLIVDKLQDNFLRAGRSTSASQQRSNRQSSNSTMDHYEKCFSIFKFKPSWLLESSDDDDSFKAVRVDLIVVPVEEMPYAVLGWTGTKHFEREIRRYARTEKQMILTSHGMHSLDSTVSYGAASEEDIFRQLGLEFREPSERCC